MISIWSLLVSVYARAKLAAASDLAMNFEDASFPRMSVLDRNFYFFFVLVQVQFWIQFSWAQ
jgi:hypothetical protein